MKNVSTNLPIFIHICESRHEKQLTKGYISCDEYYNIDYVKSFTFINKDEQPRVKLRLKNLNNWSFISDSVEIFKSIVN